MSIRLILLLKKRGMTKETTTTFFTDPKLNLEAFNDVLQDPEKGLTYAALIGKRKQSLKDAERLLPTMLPIL